MAVILEVKDGVLQLVQGDKRYVAKAEGLFEAVEKGMPEVKIEGKDAQRVLDGALVEIETKGAALSKEVKTALAGSIDGFSGAAATNRFGKIKAAIGEAAKLEHVVDAKAAEAILKANPLAETFLTEAGTKKLADIKFDMAAFKDGLKAIEAKAATVKKLNADLVTLMSAEKPDPKAVNAFLQANQAHLADLTPGDELVSKMKLNAKGYDFAKVQGEILGAIQTQTAEAKGLIEELIAHRSVINLNDDEAAVKKAAEAVKGIEEKLGKINGGEYSAAVKAGLPKELVKELGEVHPEMGAKLGAATSAAKGANWIKGGKWYGFFHDAESAGPEIAKVGKFRWGKAAIIGIPVGAALTYFLAGTGNKGPGERAEAVSKGREGQAVGVGV